MFAVHANSGRRFAVKRFDGHPETAANQGVTRDKWPAHLSSGRGTNDRYADRLGTKTAAEGEKEPAERQPPAGAIRSERVVCESEAGRADHFSNDAVAL